MKCPKCSFEQENGGIECVKCGIVFFKYNRTRQRIKYLDQPQSTYLIWTRQKDSNPIYRKLRILLLLWLVWISWSFIFSPVSFYGNHAAHSFFHNINLPFHEFGHLLFRPFGRFMHALGGSLGQLLMPLICFGVLLWKTRDAFGAAVCMWWFGESLLDLVSYIDDARSLNMPLLGGNFGYSSPYGFHDWEFILTESGLLQWDHALAKAAHILGSLVMVTAIIWMTLLLFRKHQGDKNMQHNPMM